MLRNLREDVKGASVTWPLAEPLELRSLIGDYTGRVHSLRNVVRVLRELGLIEHPPRRGRRLRREAQEVTGTWPVFSGGRTS